MDPTDANTAHGHRRTIRFHDKVRTGCLTCKKRKVKCDEAKPHCRRCTSTGRACGGYRRPRAEIPPEQARLAALSTSHAQLFASPAERRSFAYFLSRASKSLSGYFNASFWGREVLQAAIHFPPVRHLVIALGAAYESFEAGQPEQATEFALQQSNRAIRQLAALSCQPASVSSPDTKHRAAAAETSYCVLTASVLFIFLASVRGQFGEAFQHVRHAIRVLREFERSLQLQQRDGAASSVFPVPVAQLRALLTSAYGQLRAMIDDNTTSDAGAPDILVSDLKPATIFTSTAEAHAYTEKLFQNTLAFLQQTTTQSLSTADCVGLEATVARHRELCEALESSQRALDVLAAQQRSEVAHGQDGECEGIVVLRVYHLLLATRLRINIFLPEERESSFDELEAQLETMLRHCEFLVQRSSTHTAGQPSCSSGLGFVMPLHMIAARCRNPSLRRRALELLASRPHREGLWDAMLAAKIAAQTVDKEEAAAADSPADADDMQGGSLLRRDGRVREVRLELRGERTAVLHFVTVADWKQGRCGSQSLIEW